MEVGKAKRKKVNSGSIKRHRGVLEADILDDVYVYTHVCLHLSATHTYVHIYIYTRIQRRRERITPLGRFSQRRFSNHLRSVCVLGERNGRNITFQQGKWSIMTYRHCLVGFPSKKALIDDVVTSGIPFVIANNISPCCIIPYRPIKRQSRSIDILCNLRCSCIILENLRLIKVINPELELAWGCRKTYGRPFSR